MKFHSSIRLLSFLVICCLFSPSLSAQEMDPLDEDFGFMYWKLGAHIDSVKNVTKDGRTQKLHRYKPTSGKVSFEEIPLKSVYIYFWRGRVHSIEVKTRAAETKPFLDKMKERYGEGEALDNLGGKIVWEGVLTRLIFEQNLISRDAVFTFLCEEVHEKYYNTMMGYDEE